MDGEPRPMGRGYDIGMDEVKGRVFLPVVVRG
jgi:hypothetical protein